MIAASAFLVLAALSTASASICSDHSFSCSRCISNGCVYAYVTMEGGPGTEMPPRWLPHGCVKRAADDMTLDRIRRSPARELSRSGVILQGLLQVSKLHDSNVAFITEDQKHYCQKIVDPEERRLPGSNSQERITRVVKIAMKRQQTMLAKMTPIQRSRDTSTWFQHIFDDEIDDACDEFLRMGREERQAMGLQTGMMPEMDILPIASNLGSYMLARQVRRTMGYIAAHTGSVDPTVDKELSSIMANTRLAMEVSCRYLTCLVDFGATVVYDDLVGSDGKPLGNGLGLPCRYCRRLGHGFSDPRPAIAKQATVLLNGVCKSMREYTNSGSDHKAATCAVTAGQAFVHTLRAIQEAMDDSTGGSDTAMDTAVTALTMHITDSGVCQARSNSVGHWASRTPADYSDRIQAAADDADASVDHVKMSKEIQEWRSSGVANGSPKELYPTVDLS